MDESEITTLESEVSKSKQKKGFKKGVIIIFSVIAIIIAITAILLFHFLYKVPHDQAVAYFNVAIEEYNTAVAALEEKNKGLDDSIEFLRSTVNADNLPLDETLLAVADAILEEARSVPKDSAPLIPEMPSKTDDINAVCSEIAQVTNEVSAMGDYSIIIAKLAETQSIYETLIQQFQRASSTVMWVGVDEEATLLRFVAKITNSNIYALTGVTTEWIAFDKNDAVVGSSSGSRPDIPAGGSIYYVGGAGSANLSATPDRVELKITSDGLLTERVVPNISVSNVQVANNGFGSFTVTADCTTDSEINTVDIIGEIFVKDADGQIIDANFWGAGNLPDILPANGKFVLSNRFSDLPTIPASAEVYVYHNLA